MDKVILGKGCFLEDSANSFSPNRNIAVVGCSGTGKTFSVLLPSILHMRKDSMIATYSKASEARKVANYLGSMGGYQVNICDLMNPEKSTVGFDPLKYLTSYLDVEELATSVVLANPDNNDPKNVYWNDGAISLLSTLISATLMTENDPTMADVLNLFDRLKIEESNGRSITTSLDGLFDRIALKASDCPAVSGFNDLRQLPFATAGCVRDTLAKAIRRMFPEPIRQLMRNQKTIDFQKLANKKEALIIITSPVNTSLYYFANLVFGTAIKQLLEYAERCPNQKLPREVRLLFDDFACAAKVNDFSRHIAIMRAAGLSAMVLLQSESQLNSLYGENEATTIINNCSAYVYFPGGMDLTTCKSISQRLDVPLGEILYAPPGQVIIMQSGKKPIITQRYETLESKEYKDFLAVNKQSPKRQLFKTGI